MIKIDLNKKLPKLQDAVPGQSLPGEESPTSGKYPQPSASIETTPIDRTGEFGFNIIDNTNRVQDQEIILQPAPSDITYTPEPAQNLIDVTPIANVEIDRTGERTDSKEAAEETILNQKNKLAQTYLQNPNTSYKIDKLGSYYQEGIIDEAQYSAAFGQYESYYNEAAEGYNKLLSSGVPMTTFFSQSLPTQQDLIDNPTAYNFDEMEFSYYDLNQSILPQETTIKGVDELLETSQDENFAIALRDPNLTMDNNDALWQKVEAAIYSGYTRDDILAAGMVSAAEYDNHYDASDPETKALFHRTLGLDAKDTEGRAMRAGALRMNYSTQVIDEFVNDFYGYVEDGLNFQEIADLSTSDLYTVQSLETVLPFLKDQVINPSYMEDGNSGNVIDLAKYFVDIEKIGAGINIPEGIYFEGDFNFNPESHLDYVLGTSESETESPRTSHTLQSLAGDLAASVRTGQFSAEQAKSTFLTMGEAFFLPIRENNEGRVIIDADEYDNFSNQLKEIHEGLDFSTLEKEFTTEMAHINDRINSFSESFSSYIDNLTDYTNLANQFTEDFSNWAYVDFSFSNRDDAYEYVNSQYEAVYSEYEDIWKNMLVPELVDMPKRSVDGSTTTDDGTPKYFAALNADGATLKRDSRGNVVYMTMEDYLGSPDPQAELQSYDRSFMENVHMALDGIGMVDGFLIGELADLVNAGLYASEGEYGYASLSLASVVPGASLALAPAKMAKYGKAFLGAVETLPKVTRTSLKGVGYVGLGTLKLAEIAEVAVNPFSAGAKSINMVKRSINAADALKTTTNVGKAAKPFLQDDGSNIVRHLDENGVETTSISRPQNTNTIELRDGEGNLIASTKSDDFSDDMKKMLSSEEAATKGYVIKFLDADGKQLGKGVNTKTFFEATGPSKPEGFPERVTKPDAPSAQTVEGATDAPSAPDGSPGTSPQGSPQGSPDGSPSRPPQGVLERVREFFYPSAGGMEPSEIGSPILSNNKTYKLKPNEKIVIFKKGKIFYEGPIKNAPEDFVVKEGRRSYTINNRTGSQATVSLGYSANGRDIAKEARQLQKAIYENPELRELLEYEARFWSSENIGNLKRMEGPLSDVMRRINKQSGPFNTPENRFILPGYGAAFDRAEGLGVGLFDAKQMAQYGLMKSLDLESSKIADLFPFRDVDHIESFKDDVYKLANTNPDSWTPKNGDIVYAYDFNASGGQELKFYQFEAAGNKPFGTHPPGRNNPLGNSFIPVDPNDPRIQNMSYDDWVSMAARSHGNNAVTTQGMKSSGNRGDLVNYRKLAYGEYEDILGDVITTEKPTGGRAEFAGGISELTPEDLYSRLMDTRQVVFNSLLENIDNIDNIEGAVKTQVARVRFQTGMGDYGGGSTNFHETGHLMSLSPLMQNPGDTHMDSRVLELYAQKGVRPSTYSPKTLFDYEMSSTILGGDYLDDASLALEIPVDGMQKNVYDLYSRNRNLRGDLDKVMKGASISDAFEFDVSQDAVKDFANFKLNKVEDGVLHWTDGVGKQHTHSVPGKKSLSNLSWEDLPTDFKSALLLAPAYLKQPEVFFLKNSKYNTTLSGETNGAKIYNGMEQEMKFLFGDKDIYYPSQLGRYTLSEPRTYIDFMDNMRSSTARQNLFIHNTLKLFPEDSTPGRFAEEIDDLSDNSKYRMFYLLFNKNEPSAYAGEMRGKALRLGLGVNYRPDGRPMPKDLTKEDLDMIFDTDSRIMFLPSVEKPNMQISTSFPKTFRGDWSPRTQQVRDKLLKSFNETLTFEQGGKIPVRKHQEYDEFGNVFLDPNKPISQQTETLTEGQQERANIETTGAKQYVDPTYFNNYVEAATTFTPEKFEYAPNRVGTAKSLATEKYYNEPLYVDEDIKDPTYRDLFYDSEVFTENWMNSPQYKKMLKESTDSETKYDYDYLSEARRFNFEESKGNQFIKNNLKMTPWEVLTSPSAGAAAFSLSNRPQTIYRKPAAIPFFSPLWTPETILRSVAIHEMSHATDRPLRSQNAHKRLIPSKDVELIEDLALSEDEIENNFLLNMLNPAPMLNAASGESVSEYYSDPTEVRARLNEIRALLARDYGKDVFNYDITMDDLDKARRNYVPVQGTPANSNHRALMELISTFGREGTLQLLNTISQAEPQQEQEENFYAKKGGKVSKKKRDVPMDVNSRIKLDLQQKLGVNVDNLTPIPIGSRGLKEFAKKNPLAVAALGHNPFRVAGSPPRDLLL